MATPPGCPLGGKEEVIPGAYVARPYRLYLVARGRHGSWGRRRRRGMKDSHQSGESWQGGDEKHWVEASGQIVLECGGCGERLILLGLEEDWSKEHGDAFDCRGCDKTVTLAHRVDGTANTLKSLLRNSMRSLHPGA
jgi:hypothetical protein